MNYPLTRRITITSHRDVRQAQQLRDEHPMGVILVVSPHNGRPLGHVHEGSISSLLFQNWSPLELIRRAALCVVGAEYRRRSIAERRAIMDTIRQFRRNYERAAA